MIFAWPDALRNIDLSAFAIAAVTLVVGVVWPSRFRKFLPPTLAALVAGTLLGVLWLNDVPVIGEVPTGLPQLRSPDLSLNVLARAVQPALIIALLGSIDSLLTSLIADSMTRTRHNPNRELVGQGIGNMVAGLIGGLPGCRGHHGHRGEHTRGRGARRSQERCALLSCSPSFWALGNTSRPFPMRSLPASS